MDGEGWVPPAVHEYFLLCIVDQLVMTNVCTVLFLENRCMKKFFVKATMIQLNLFHMTTEGNGISPNYEDVCIKEVGLI